MLKDAQLAQLGLHGRDVAALFGVARDLVDDVFQVFACLELEEILFAQLESLSAHAKILDARVDERVEVLVVEVLHALERVDHAADGLGGLALLIGGQKKRVDEVVERLIEVLQLELDAAGDLGETAVERIELARRLDLVVRHVPFALREVEPAEDFEGAIVVGGLQLGDLEQLDRLRRLILGHVVLREADVLRCVDLVAGPLGHHFLPHRRVARFFSLAFQIANAGQVDAQRHRARLELLRHLVEVDRLVVHALLGVAARQHDEVVGLDRDRAFGRDRTEPRAGRNGLFGHLLDYYRSP